MEIVFRDVSMVNGERKILNNISGVASPGHVLAIMGPSGGGKTTLLNCLAGRQALHSGEITVNGLPLDKSIKHKLSYVLQEDVFFPNLTLRETLSFTAMLRLSDKMSKTEKLKKMEQIIDDLDIRKCLDTIMGDAWVRGISGGEKKRASIACELITDPAIIFLDEPTSGLDYSTASSLIRTLRHITESMNKTVVMSIHQPSSQMFYTFHNLLLLCEGQLAYFGPCANVIDFFANAGYVMDSHYNPADFIIEKLKEGSDIQKQIITAAEQLRNLDSWPKQLKSEYISLEEETKSNRNGVEISGKQNKYFGHQILKKADETGDNDKGNTNDVHVALMDVEGGTHKSDSHCNEEKWPTGWMTQFIQLTQRTFRESRVRILNKLRILEAVLLCIMVCMVWFQLPRSEETLRDRMGAIFFTVIHWAFTPMFDAVHSFPGERVVIHKERAAGWYRLSAYYLAKMTSELPLILVLPTCFVIISYWVIGLNGVGAFFATLFTIMINAIVGQSIGLFLGIVLMDITRAMTISTIIMMFIMVLGGFYVRNLPFWLDWVKYFSFLHYSFHAALILEFTDAEPVMCAASAGASQFSSCLEGNATTVTSEEVLKFYHVDFTYWQYILPLVLAIIAFRLAGYFVLKFAFKPQSG